MQKILRRMQPSAGALPGRFEMKGLVVLAICVAYTVALFTAVTAFKISLYIIRQLSTKKELRITETQIYETTTGLGFQKSQVTHPTQKRG